MKCFKENVWYCMIFLWVCGPLSDFGENTDWAKDGDWWSKRLHRLFDWEGITGQRSSEESQQSTETESWEVWSCNWEMLSATEGKGMKLQQRWFMLLLLFFFRILLLLSSLGPQTGCSTGQCTFRKRLQEVAKGPDDRGEEQTWSARRVVTKVQCSTNTHLCWGNQHRHTASANFPSWILCFVKSYWRLDNKAAEGERWAQCSSPNPDATRWKAQDWKRRHQCQ